MAKTLSMHDVQPFLDLLGPRGVMTDPDLIAPWLHDWRGRFHGTALAILQPDTAAQTAAAVALAAQMGIALVPQGGNTSMVGGATPPADGSALILSTRRMNRIRLLSPDDNIAVCEAGVILSDLHAAAAQAGRRFPLSLGAKGSATVGGLASTNAGGTQVLRHGTMRMLVAGIEVVLPDGSLFDGLSALVKDTRGYDLRHLLIGAEGTLGIITAVSVRLAPAITNGGTAWVSLASPDVALRLLRTLDARLGSLVEGFEVIRDDGLGHVLGHLPGARCPVQERAPWHALIEVASDDPADAALPRLEAALASAMEMDGIIDATVAQSEAQSAEFWTLRESLSAAEKAQGPALQFDVSVPVPLMPGFITDSIAACEAAFSGVTASAYGHLGDGNIHFHVRAPAGTMDGPAWVTARGNEISAFVHDRVVALGGSISAEHGIGQMKRAEFGRLSSPARLHALRAIKSAIDPQAIMNPGKLIPLASEG